jgi:hypothetical protein
MIIDNDNTAWRGNSQDPGGGNPALIGWGEAIEAIRIRYISIYMRIGYGMLET